MVQDISKWPAVLTDRDWQKKKGAFAKLTGKTGIGATLIEAEKLYRRGNPAAMDMGNIHGNPKLADYIAGKQAAVDFHRKNVEPVRAALRVAADLATRTAAEWTKSKTVPSTAAAAATTLATAATTYSDALKIDSPEVKRLLGPYDTQIKVLQDLTDGYMVMFDDLLASLQKQLLELKAEPTEAKWTDSTRGVMQSYRALLAAIKRVPSLMAAYGKDWDQYQPGVLLKDCPSGDAEAAFIKAKMKILMVAHQDFTKNYKRILAS